MQTEPTAKARRTFFIDSENHINTCLQGIESLTENDLVVVFHRESNLSQKQKEAIKDSPARIEWILCQDSGVKNSLDVQLIAELSRRIACHEIENGYIVSQDQGYKPAIHYLLNRYADEFRFLGLKKSIDEFMLADALVSAESRQDVHEALVRSAGQIVGTAMYRTIRDIFDATSDSEEPEGGYTVEGAPLFPEPAEEPSKPNGTAANNGNGVGNGNSQRSKSNKRRKPRSASKPAAETNSNDSASIEAEAPQSEAAPLEAKPFEHEPAKTEAAPMRSRRSRQKQSQAVEATSHDAETPSETMPDDKPQEASAKPRRSSRSAAGKAQPAPSATQLEVKAEAETSPEKQPAAKPSRRRGRKPAPAEPKQQTPLENLPGIGKALAARLESVGIPTAEALKEKGSRASWVLLKKQDNATSINWLYALEGAVLGIAVKELDDETKTALKSFSKLAL